MSVAPYCLPSDVAVMFPSLVASVTTPALNAAILAASGEIEGYTQRILTQGTYTEEDVLRIDRYQRIVGKVRQWPIQSVSALSFSVDGLGASATLNTAQVDTQRPPDRLFYYTGPVSLPQPQMLGASTMLLRGTPGIIAFTYIGGYATLPQDVVNAAVLLTADYIMRDANLLGAQSISLSLPPGGSSTTSWGSGMTTHATQAYKTLERYRRRD